jgi:hypothetical protein
MRLDHFQALQPGDTIRLTRGTQPREVLEVNRATPTQQWRRPRVTIALRGRSSLGVVYVGQDQAKQWDLDIRLSTVVPHYGRSVDKLVRHDELLSKS